ncbi:interaptin [Legionella brunensis]|uniref:Interaptin n=1 Tax=Legionella brunensis TaxID=29422 RepID=A0A0W0S0L3_9GAMM|nr:interaptin [Legionella brunensis]
MVKVSSLEKQVETYKEKVDELITSLEEEKKLTKELGDQLSETKVQLEESQLKSKQLEQEIDETKKRHEEELSDLRSEVESAKEGKSEAEAKLRLAQERHAKELEDITSQLEASQQEAEELLVKLQNQGEQLKEKLQTIERLRVSLQQLEQEKATLTEKLSEEKNLRESERKHLESLLDTETQAKLKAESDLKELKTTVDELTQTNEELLSKAQQLEEANELLKEVVADLRSEIKGYKEDIEQGKKELAEERRKTEKANEALEKEREVTQRLKEEIESMRLEMDRLREEMERREKKVDEREKAVESREQQVKRRENEVGQRESNVGVRETKLASKKDALREAKRAHKERIRQHSEERQRHEEDFRRREAAILRRRDPEDPQLVAQRKAIAKLKARIGVSKDDVLLINVRRAENNNDLIEAGLNRRLVSLLGTNDYLTIADAADERLTALRQARLQKKTNLLGANYQRILNHDKDELRDIYNHLKNITTLDKGIQSELKYLAKTSPIHWFNPGFQAAAKKHAEEMAPHYAKLADGCSVIVDYLKPLSHELNDQLKSLPAPGEMRGLNDAQKKAIEEHRAVLTRYLHQVNEELALYEPLYKQLYGDPHASHPLVKQGILKTIQQAKEDKHALKFLSFASSYSDHPQEERSAHFQEGYESDRDGNVTTVSGTVGGGVYYRPVQWAKAGYFRQYEINGDSDFHGYFIEEHYSSNYNPAEGDDYQEYQSDVKLTLNKFPEGPDPNDPELITARVEYSLAVAAQMLAGYSEPPNEETPVILQGDNPEELRYVFTALATIGREVPLFKYDSTAIAIISNAFHYSQEMEKVFSLLGWREQFTQDSCYETCFKNQPSLKLWLAGIKEATEHKLGHQKERGQIKKAVGQVTHTFFGNTKSKEVIEELRQINELRGPECAG